MYFVYIIQSLEGRYYIGSSENTEHRLSQHNSKQFKGWTNRFSGWRLVYQEMFESRTDAIIREREIKSWKGGRKFKLADLT